MPEESRRDFSSRLPASQTFVDRSTPIPEYSQVRTGFSRVRDSPEPKCRHQHQAPGFATRGAKLLISFLLS